MADWLCMGWSACQAEIKAGNSNRRIFILHKPVYSKEYSTNFFASASSNFCPIDARARFSGVFALPSVNNRYEAEVCTT